MKSPKRLDFSPEQIETLIERLNGESLTKEDYPILANLIKAIVWMNFSLQEKQLSIHRLRAVFGIKTESAKNLAKFIKEQEAEESRSAQNTEQCSEASEWDTKSEENDNQSAAPDQEPASDTEFKGSNPGTPDPSSPEKTKKGHGHRSSSGYTEAKNIPVPHKTLQKGDPCPSCGKGKLFNLSPGVVLHITGQPWLQVDIYNPERLRCSVCGQIFTATLPQEIMITSRADSSAKAMVSLLKYRGGVPFYRQNQLQEILGAPVSASEIWEMTEDVADAVQPVYSILCELAASAELVQNDDTKARILSVMKDRAERKGTESEDKRKGIFTTGILATLKDMGVKIGLFFTGIKHAGENLDDLLNKRPEELATPIQQCDGGNNEPKNHDTHLSNCNAHCRRKFYEIVETWPQMVIKIIGWFATVFANEKSAPTDPILRLQWHQKHSGPIMEQLKTYCNELIEQKKVEPNSSMGKAIAYLNNHWEGLTLFLRMPGVPIDNNGTERLLKRAVLNRKNAYFYRNETGAKIGDILMSVMETCVLNEVNPWNYLVAIQEHQRDVQKNPTLWVPWAYKKRLNELCPP